MRIAFLGPRGTFNDDALRRAAAGQDFEGLPAPTVPETILMVERGDAERALVPIENSFEGTVRPTLDTLVHEAEGVTIVGEYDYAVHQALIAERELELGEIEAVLSHPQPIAQCARFLRESLPGADIRAVSSTAEAVRMVSEEKMRPWAALGSIAAAEIYGATVLREGVEEDSDNVTRFAWIAPRDTTPAGDGPWKTSLVFHELGEDHPGALTDALVEFSSREINLTRIESRPLRRGLGRYMFFIDLEGSAADEPVAAAIEALRSKAESVRVLGSYPTGATGATL